MRKRGGTGHNVVRRDLPAGFTGESAADDLVRRRRRNPPAAVSIRHHKRLRRPPQVEIRLRKRLYSNSQNREPVAYRMGTRCRRWRRSRQARLYFMLRPIQRPVTPPPTATAQFIARAANVRAGRKIGSTRIPEVVAILALAVLPFLVSVGFT